MNNTNQRKLILQHSYLSIELEEVSEVCSSTEKEIREAIKNNYPEHCERIFGDKTKNSKNNKNSENTNLSNRVKNKDMKIIYRKIVRKIHPDKKNGDADMFSKAAKAYEEDNVGILLEIAAEINLKIDNLSEEAVLILKSNINHLSDKIKNKKASAAWHWVGADDGKKDQILRHIIKHKGGVI